MAQDRAAQHVVIRFSATSAVVAVAVVVLAVVGQRVFVAAHRPLSWGAAAVVVAVLITPIADLLDRIPHVPRFLSVLAGLFVAAALAFGVIYLAFDDLAAGIDRFGEAAQDAAGRLEDRDDGVGQLAQDVDASRRVELLVEGLDARVTGGQDVLESGAGSAPTYFVGVILTLFLMSYGPRLATSAVEQLPDPEQRRAVTKTVTRAVTRSRRAILLNVGEALVVGLIAAGIARLLGLPASAALGLGAGVFALLPHVGIMLGAMPIVLLTLALRSDVAAITAFVIAVIFQLADSLIVRRAISRYSVHVGLLVPWVVVLLGYRVYGVGGAAYGLVFAVFAVAVLDDLGPRRHPEPESEPPPAVEGGVESEATR